MNKKNVCVQHQQVDPNSLTTKVLFQNQGRKIDCQIIFFNTIGKYPNWQMYQLTNIPIGEYSHFAAKVFIYNCHSLHVQLVL